MSLGTGGMTDVRASRILSGEKEYDVYDAHSPVLGSVLADSKRAYEASVGDPNSAYAKRPAKTPTLLRSAQSKNIQSFRFGTEMSQTDFF